MKRARRALWDEGGFDPHGSSAPFFVRAGGRRDPGAGNSHVRFRIGMVLGDLIGILSFDDSSHADKETSQSAFPGEGRGTTEGGG